MRMSFPNLLWRMNIQLGNRRSRRPHHSVGIAQQRFDQRDVVRISAVGHNAALGPGQEAEQRPTGIS